MSYLFSASALLIALACATPLQAQDIAVTTMTFMSLTDGQAADGASGTVFKPVVPGEGIIYNFTIRNTAAAGNLVLTLPITVTGTNPGDFVIGQPGGSATLAPGEGRSFSISWIPQANGTRTATVNITSNDPDAESTFSFGVSGIRYFGSTPTYPNLEVEPVSELPLFSKFRKSTATQTVKGKVAVSNDKANPMETGTLQVFKSTLPYLLPSDMPILEIPLKPLPGPVNGKPGKVKKYKFKADVGDMTDGFLYARVIPLTPSATEWHWNDNVKQLPFGPKVK